MLKMKMTSKILNKVLVITAALTSSLDFSDETKESDYQTSKQLYVGCTTVSNLYDYQVFNPLKNVKYFFMSFYPIL